MLAATPRPLALALSLAAIVVVNLLPLAGVAWWGWNLATILTTYWAETGVLAALVVVLAILAPAPPGVDATQVEMERGFGIGLLSSVYVGAWLMLGGFIVIVLPLIEIIPALLAGDPTSVAWPDLPAALGAAFFLALGQAWALWRHAGQRPGVLHYLVVVSARTIALVAMILVGVIGFFAYGSTHGALYVLIIFKIAIDLVVHVRRALAGVTTVALAESGTAPETAMPDVVA